MDRTSQPSLTAAGQNATPPRRGPAHARPGDGRAAPARRPTVGVEDDEWNVHFSESGAGRHRPRAIFIGSEPSSIDAIRTGSWRQLYLPEQLISGQYACYDSLSETDNGLHCGVPDDEITSAEGEAYFAEVNDLALDRIRRLADNTTGLAGFRVISSAEEGFGSGAGKLLLESLAAEYPTKSIHTYTVLPPRSSLDGSAIVTYNALFALAPTEEIASRAYVFGADTIETDVQAAVVASLLADSPHNFADNVGDGLADKADNCPVDYNVDQANTDGDGQGDACDGDDDADGVLDAADNCALVGNPSQANFDGDGNGDACDGDDDADAIADQSDACPATSLSSLVDSRGCSGVQYVALTCSTTTTWKNHGAYVSCVSSAARAAKASGLLSKDESGVIVSTAAKSTIGK